MGTITISDMYAIARLLGLENRPIEICIRYDDLPAKACSRLSVKKLDTDKPVFVLSS